MWAGARRIGRIWSGLKLIMEGLRGREIPAGASRLFPACGMRDQISLSEVLDKNDVTIQRIHLFAGSNVHRENVEPKELRKLRLRGHSRANKEEVYTSSPPITGCYKQQISDSLSRHRRLTRALPARH